MPAYHLTAPDRRGISLVNIGVGPSNAKTITDHLAVLRPEVWLMIGHCGGLRSTQAIGDYVLAHAYLRDDHVLDDMLPPEIPVPALAEVQVALTRAAEIVTGESGDALKARLRTGTVVTTDDRNWELRYSHSALRFNLSRAIRYRHGKRHNRRPKAIACARPMERCSASPTSRCTERLSCRAKPTRSTPAPSHSIYVSAWRPLSSYAPKANVCTLENSEASTSRRSVRGLSEGRNSTSI